MDDGIVSSKDISQHLKDGKRENPRYAQKVERGRSAKGFQSYVVERAQDSAENLAVALGTARVSKRL